MKIRKKKKEKGNQISEWTKKQVIKCKQIYYKVKGKM